MAKYWLASGLLAALALLVSDLPAVTAPAALVALVAMAALLGASLLPHRYSEVWERTTISIAAGFVALILGGLALSAAGLALEKRSWLALVVLIMLVSGLVALREPVRSPMRQRPPVGKQRIRSPWQRLVSLHWWIQVGIGLLVFIALSQVVLATGLAVAGARNAPQTPFTQLTLTHPQLADYAVVGLANHELSDETYRVEALVDGEIVTTWLLTSLPRGERWTARLPLPSSWQNVVARVYRLPNPTIPYRQTVVWNHEQP